MFIQHRLPIRYAMAAASLVAALLLNLAALTWSAQSQAQSAANRAALIVQFPDGSILNRCVSFSEPEINGYDLLRRAQLPLVVEAGSMGATVCKIGQAGCDYPAQPCFCQCRDLNASCTYWIYFVLVDGNWRYAALGALGQKVENGSVNGWIWGSGKSDGANVAPPIVSFDQVCGAADAQPAAGATAESTAKPVQPESPAASASEPVATETQAPVVALGATAAPPVKETATASSATDATAAAPPAPTPTADSASASPTSSPMSAQASPAPTSTPISEPVPLSPTPAETPAATADPTPVVVQSGGGNSGNGAGGLLVFGGIVAALGAILFIGQRASKKAGGRR